MIKYHHNSSLKGCRPRFIYFLLNLKQKCILIEVFKVMLHLLGEYTNHINVLRTKSSFNLSIKSECALIINHHSPPYLHTTFIVFGNVFKFKLSSINSEEILFYFVDDETSPNVVKSSPSLFNIIPTPSTSLIDSIFVSSLIFFCLYFISSFSVIPSTPPLYLSLTIVFFNAHDHIF